MFPRLLCALLTDRLGYEKLSAMPYGGGGIDIVQ